MLIKIKVPLAGCLFLGLAPLHDFRKRGSARDGPLPHLFPVYGAVCVAAVWKPLRVGGGSPPSIHLFVRQCLVMLYKGGDPLGTNAKSVVTVSHVPQKTLP